MSNPPTPGRRAARRRGAPRPRPALTPGLVGAAVLVVVSAGLLVIGGVVDGEGPAAAQRETVPVDRTVNTCLGSPVPTRTEARTLAAPLPEDVGRSGAGAVRVSGGPEAQGRALGAGESGRGQLTSLGPVARGSALTVSATGPAAVGRVGDQVDRARSGSALAGRECPAPRGRWWFTGGGADLDHSSELVLANVDPGRAVVDLVVHGPDGVLPTLGTRGVTLEPGEVRSFETLELAPQATDLSVHVEATRGRVVAAMSDSFSAEPGAPEGLEWIPAQEAASRVVRLAPLPRRASRRTLVVANPADREILVSVEVSGATGAFAPTDAAQVRVPPGAAVSTDLTDAIGREPSAVVLRAPVPVAATLRSVSGGDTSYAAAAPTLTGPAAALLTEGGSASVQLTAAATGGAAALAAYDDTGEQVDSDDLSLEPGATGSWSPRRSAAYVVVTPRDGRLAGGVVTSTGGGTTQAALRPLQVEVRRPSVVPMVR